MIMMMIIVTPPKSLATQRHTLSPQRIRNAKAHALNSHSTPNPKPAARDNNHNSNIDDDDQNRDHDTKNNNLIYSIRYANPKYSNSL